MKPPFINHLYICISQNTYHSLSLRWWMWKQLNRVIKSLHLQHQRWGRWENSSYTRWAGHLLESLMLRSMTCSYRFLLCSNRSLFFIQQGIHSQLNKVSINWKQSHSSLLCLQLCLSTPCSFSFPLIFSSATSPAFSALLGSTYKISSSFTLMYLYPLTPY